MNIIKAFKTNTQLARQLDETNKRLDFAIKALAHKDIELANCKSKLIAAEGKVALSKYPIGTSDIIGGALIRAFSPLLPESIKRAVK